MNDTPQRILILKPSSLGDIIHTLPTLAALRERFPSSSITWLVKEEWAEILEDNPNLDEVLPVNLELRFWPAIIRRMRDRHFDLVIDLQGLFRSGLLAILSGAPERIGFAAGREGSPWFYTHRVRLPMHGEQPWRLLNLHAVDRNLAVAEFLGADISRPHFFLPDNVADHQMITRWFREAGVLPNDRVIALAPQARQDVKSWPLERFVHVARMLCQWENCKVVLLGAEAQRSIVAKFASIRSSNLIDMVGKLRLRQLGALFRRTDLLIANDSAPIHIAAAVGTKVLAIFGPTHVGATGPYGFGLHTVMTTNLPCRPCGKKVCYHVIKKECLTAISIEEVVNAAKASLDRSRNAAVPV